MYEMKNANLTLVKVKYAFLCSDKPIQKKPIKIKGNCLMINTEVLVAVNCFLGSSGYICEQKGKYLNITMYNYLSRLHILLKYQTNGVFILDCSHCASAPSVPCYHHRGSCFHRYCGADNWFDARYRCKNRGMNLAVSVIDHQSNPALQKWLQDSSCNSLWLGYSKEEWYQTTPSGGRYQQL